MEARERYLAKGGSDMPPNNTLNSAKRLAHLVEDVYGDKKKRENKKVS